jgi:DNA-binding LacI/PurR family transcriptional regulator
MADVAAIAGVSQQTVSRVLNDHPHVSARARERVTSAIAQLDYRPNEAARALATGRSRVIGVVAHGSPHYGPASLVTSLVQAASGVGFAVSLVSIPHVGRHALVEAVDRHLSRRVDGLVVFAPVQFAGSALAHVPAGMPLVTVNGDPKRSIPSVAIDHEEGARLATRHLLDAGHRTVWHVAGPPGWFDSAGRITGWERALRGAGAPVPPPIQADWSAGSGYEAGRALARMPEVTAVFAANDHLALGLMRALREAGKSVPCDVSVVGYDDVPGAECYLPPLTTIRPDFARVAQGALAALLGQMEHRQQTASPVAVPPQLIVRGSVAPPRAAVAV